MEGPSGVDQVQALHASPQRPGFRGRIGTLRLPRPQPLTVSMPGPQRNRRRILSATTCPSPRVLYLPIDRARAGVTRLARPIRILYKSSEYTHALQQHAPLLLAAGVRPAAPRLHARDLGVWMRRWLQFPTTSIPPGMRRRFGARLVRLLPGQTGYQTFRACAHACTWNRMAWRCGPA